MIEKLNLISLKVRNNAFLLSFAFPFAVFVYYCIGRLCYLNKVHL